MLTINKRGMAYVVTGVLAALVAVSAPPGGGVGAIAAETTKASAAKQQGLVDGARSTIEAFSGDHQLTWVRDNMKDAKAVLIIPEQVKGGLMIGGSGGSGVALARTADGTWSYPAFFTMGSITFGFQAGGQVSEIVLMAMTPKGADALKGDSFKLGGDVSVAAGPVGAGAKGQLADVVAFSRAKGLYGGLNVEGAMIKSRAEWNHTYYGKTVSMAEILDGKASNPHADGLRSALDKIRTATATDGTRIGG